MDDRRLRVGVIGAGIGAIHAKAYAQNPRVEITALAGLDYERVQALAEEYHVPNTFRQYEELLALPDIDAVSVCVPNVLHAPVSIAALKAGKHVLVEKPLARNIEEGRAMLEAAREAGRVLMVSFNWRHRGDVQWLKRYVDSGALGRIYYAKAFWMRRAGIPRLGSWFVNKEMAGGGPLIDLGVHVLDMAMYVLGEPKPLSVSGATYAEFGPRGLKNWDLRGVTTTERMPYEVEDLATAFIRLDGGGTLTLEASWATHGSNGDDLGIVLYGTEGGAELIIRDYSYENTVRIFSDFGGAPVDATPKIPRGEGHLAVIQRFVEAALDGAPAIPSAEEGLRRTEVIDACYRSAALGREVTIEEL